MVMHPEIFGALGDGVHDDGPAIQEAINACCACGGGEVLLSGGKTYLSRFLILRSGVDLRVEEGSVLKAWAHHLFCPDRPPHEAGEEAEVLDTGKPSGIFLYALNCHGLHIHGEGSICGGDAGTMDTALLYLDQCEHVKVQGLTLKAEGDLLCFGGCRDVRAIEVCMETLQGCGMVLDHTREVRLERCRMQGGSNFFRVRDSRAQADQLPSNDIQVIE